MTQSLSRRDLVRSTGALMGATVGLDLASAQTEVSEKHSPIRYCMNSALIRGYDLGIVEQIALAKNAGYDAMEPWVRDIRKYQDQGGDLRALKKRFEDANLTIESVIAFSSWIVDDPKKRAEGIEQAKQDMEILAQIGGKRIAAPPVGATKGSKLDLFAAAERYRAILEIGESIGVVPQIEVWGFSANLSRLGESLFVAVEAGHPQACLLPDFYHIYKGGSSFEGLKLLNGNAVQVFHMNDYPAIPRDKIADKDRVFPGDGIAPLPSLIRSMYDNGCRPVYSIEIFNRDYWAQYDAPTLAKKGLEKMKAVIAKALA